MVNANLQDEGARQLGQGSNRLEGADRLAGGRQI